MNLASGCQARGDVLDRHGGDQRFNCLSPCLADLEGVAVSTRLSGLFTDCDGCQNTPMSLPGGPADKAGNRYEAWWTVYCMSRVLRGEYDSIRLEPLGAEGKGVEFWLRRGDAKEYHQVKRRGGKGGHWRLADLHNRGVLAAFRSHLANGNATCRFVSMQGADELSVLVERARQAKDQAEFEHEFAEGEWGGKLAKLRSYWPECSETEAFGLLSRIHVRTLDEDSLLSQARLALAPLIDGDIDSAGGVLFAFVFASTHHELDTVQIWQHLRNCGFSRPPWSAPKTLTEIIAQINERYLSRLRNELILGKPIPRDETARILDMLGQNSPKRGVFLTGRAGAGKSTVLLQVVDALKNQDTPVLALRIDRLQPTLLPDEAGRQLGLPKSPVATLAALANGGRCVLILDQLDTVSLMSGRNPDFYWCLNEMVREALTQSGMRIVVACRKFDHDHDRRLRRLGGCEDAFEVVETAPLAELTVRQTVVAMGLKGDQLTAPQTKLLSVPANLKLLAEAAQSADAAAMRFDTANKLYDLYWDHKQAMLRNRLGRPAAWTAVIDKVCDYMNDQQALSAPKALLDDHAADVDVMISEHVLVKDHNRIAFFHEGFFDYAFARRFAVRIGDLTGMLRSGEQELFRRAQVRQILTYLRGADRQRYLANLLALLTAGDVRFHVKDVVFALLRAVPDPGADEWRILEPLLYDAAYPHRDHVWGAMRTAPWFALLDSQGVIAAWLASNDAKIVDQAVTLLKIARHDAADRVAELVESYVGTSNEWRNRHRYLVQWSNLHAGRRLFDLFLRLTEAGDLDGLGNSNQGGFLGFLYELAERRPEWACEALGCYLTRHLRLAREDGEMNPFRDKAGLRHSQVSDHVLIGAAQRAPGAFVKHVLPFVLQVIEQNAIREGEELWKDTVWRWRRSAGGHDVASHLLYALEEALRGLARTVPGEFRGVAASLRLSAFETVHYLLVRAYAANGAAFADEALEYLCESPNRLECGYFSGGSTYESSCEVIAAITPHCSQERLLRLEGMLLDYYPRWERSASDLGERGSAQFALLPAIDKARRSAAVEARIGEWQRNFRRDAPLPAPRAEVHIVGSPIARSAMEVMTDDEWLSAMARHSKDSEHQWCDGKPIGGAGELSHAFEAQVRKAPQRFAAFVHRIPDAANKSYFDAALRGLDQGSADPVAVFDACRRCHRLPGRPVGRAFCHLMGKLRQWPWPDDLLDAVAWYATKDADPADELWRQEASGGQCYFDGDIYMAGINSVRGAAAGTIRALLEADADRIPCFLPTLERMVRDPSIAVHSCVVTALYPVFNQNRDLAVTLFESLCETEDALLKTAYVEQFMEYASWTHFPRLRPIVERMLGSSDSEVAQTGARRASAASLVNDECMDLADRCLSGPEPLRLGAAEIYAGNVAAAPYRDLCTPTLFQFFDDPSDNVRAKAAECFTQFEGGALGEVPDLVERFLDSAAYAEHHGHLIRALKETTAQLPDATISVCERFIEIVGADAGDIRTRAAFEAHGLSQLIVRAYRQAPDASLRARCLDTIDDLLSTRAYGMEDALETFER